MPEPETLQCSPKSLGSSLAHAFPGPRASNGARTAGALFNLFLESRVLLDPKGEEESWAAATLRAYVMNPRLSLQGAHFFFL